MKKIVARTLIALGLLAANPLFAEDNKLVFVPGIELASKSDSLTIVVGGSPIKLADVNFKTITSSLAAGYGKWFAFASTEFTADPGAFSQLTTNVNGYSYRQSDFSRDESTINIGYRVRETSTSSISVFGGYHLSQADIEQTIFDYDSTATPVDAIDTEEARFKEAGPFVGVSYTRPVGKHTLTLSAAYALLDGELNDFQTDSRNGTLSHEIYYANSSGASLGLTWSGAMTENINYKIGIKYVDYNFDVTRNYDVIGDTWTPVTPGSMQITNKITSIFFGTTVYL